MCKDYIIDFPKSCDYATDITVSVTDEDMIQEQKRSAYTRLNQNNNDYLVFSDAYFETLVIYRKICNKLPKHNTILMHGSIVAYKGLGYMFIASSGTGKTTRTRLWLEQYPESIVINGDKPLLNICENKVVAYGSPWSGKENWNINTSVPLRAIFVLERADDSSNSTICELSTQDAFQYLYKQTYRPDNVQEMKKTLSLLSKLGNSVKFYLFHSKCSTDAIRLAYETAKP